MNRWQGLGWLWVVLGAVALGCGSQTEDAAAPAWSMEELSAEQGVSLRIAPFAVEKGREEQSCYFVRAPDLAAGEDYWVDRVRFAMNAGSHHMNIFRVRTIRGLGPDDGEPVKVGPYAATVVHGHDDYEHSPCWESSNWSDWPLVANTQHATAEDPYTDWQLPERVAMRFTPGEMLMLQTHYVNTDAQPTSGSAGRVGINLYRSKAKQPLELGTLFATQQSIRVCRSTPTPTYSGTCKFPGAVTITAANGHFHSRGKAFRMYAWDGKSVSHPDDADLFYESSAWSHPPMVTDIDRPTHDGSGVWWDCEYKWREPSPGCEVVDEKDPEQEGDCCYTFGGITSVGEHCNVFLYYYPKVDGTDVFCN